VKALANEIECELRRGDWKHCAVYEYQLERFWPLDAKGREAKIAEFAKRYGFPLRFYRKGLCAIFDKSPHEMGRGCIGQINAPTAAALRSGMLVFGGVYCSERRTKPKPIS
jgi:hypothetical protein